MSPSKIAAFTNCPRQFFYRHLLRLPSPDTVQVAAGIVAHSVFEQVMRAPACGRRLDAALALVESETHRPGNRRRWAHLDLSEVGRLAAAAVRGWFRLEDPAALAPRGVELRLSCEVPDGPTLVGVVDRLDVEDGDAVIVDYKTGRPPDPRFDRRVFDGVKAYAFLVREKFGLRPSRARLLYVTADPSEAVLEIPLTPRVCDAAARRAASVWRALVRAADRADFPPKPGPLCGHCPYTDVCPAQP